MIVRWPGQIGSGSTNDTPWYLADVLPTLAGVARTSAPDSIDGVNVMPVIRGEATGLGDRFLYWEFFENGFQQAARWGDWKAVRPQPGELLEIYHLARDPGETADIASRFPGIVQTFEDYFSTARTTSENWPIESLD